jgi:hypothetical protein
MKQKLTAGEEPWAKAWKRLRSEKIAALNYRPRPVPRVSEAPYGKADVGATQMETDASAAYCHALAWRLTGQKAHADVYTKGLEMPYARQVLDKIRPEGWSPVVPETFGTLTGFKGTADPAPAGTKVRKSVGG